MISCIACLCVCVCVCVWSVLVVYFLLWNIFAVVEWSLEGWRMVDYSSNKNESDKIENNDLVLDRSEVCFTSILAPTYSLDVICNIQYGAFNALTVSSRTRSIQSHKTRHSTDHTKNKKSITSSNILVPTSISFCLYLCLSSTPCIQSSFLSMDLCRYSI